MLAASTQWAPNPSVSAGTVFTTTLQATTDASDPDDTISIRSGSTGTGALAIPASPVDGVYYSQFANIHNTSSTFEANYGNPSFSISSGNADANGHGNFEYAVPSGYFALCTKNLAEHG